MIGQDELNDSEVESAVRQLLLAASGDLVTEKEALAAVRIGQHRFAWSVLENCGRACVFCGLSLADGRARRMLLASHIKPWRDCSAGERLDYRNGLAACPTHDVAFDTGLLAVNGGYRIHVASAVTQLLGHDDAADAAFGRPPLRERLVLPLGATHPGRTYLDWHRSRIFSAA